MNADSISRELYDDPDLYDRLFSGAKSVASEQFYCEEASRVGGPVLELGCGSGRLTIPMAQAGVNITGLDSSESMLAAARAKVAAGGWNVSLRRDDMRAFEVPGCFSAVIIAGNSLLHLLTNEDLISCLATVRRHLASGGRLIFDLSKWPFARLDSGGERRAMGEINGIPVEEFSAYDAEAQVRHVTWFVGNRVVEYSLRVIFPQELLLLLGYTGFRLITRYGEFTREPFDSASVRQVCICEKV